jgi:hypothetical protein
MSKASPQTPPNPQPIPQPPLDYQKWAHEQTRSVAERAHDNLDEFHRYVNEAAISAANLALRMALLINGGAAVALLSFDGHLPQKQMTAVAGTLLWFAWGVVTAVAGVALAYFTNYCMAGIASSKTKSYQAPYITEGPNTWRWVIANRIFHILAVSAGVGSLVLFIIGMFSVRSALLI